MERLLADLVKCRKLFRMELTTDERIKVRAKSKELMKQLLELSK